MTGRRQSRAKVPDARQLTMEPLFFEVPPAPSSQAGTLDIGLRIREVLGEILATAKARTEGKLDRYELAGLISRLSGRDISKNMLDRYAAPGADDWRFPLEALPALVVATGDLRLLDLVAAACGCKVLRGEEAMLAEIGALTLQERATKARLDHLRKTLPDHLMQRLTKRLGARE